MASNECEIAVIGIACRLPDCENASDFWCSIQNKEMEGLHFRGQRFHRNLKFQPIFDGNINIQSKDEVSTSRSFDFEHRFFIRSVWGALEDAGIACNVRGAGIGVYVGYSGYYCENCSDSNCNNNCNKNNGSFATRVSETFGLIGPSIAVNLNGNSSIMAIHVACQAINTGDCDTAVAGGLSLECSLQDNEKSEGVAVLVLKSLTNAVNDGNHIYGVIVGSAVNLNYREPESRDASLDMDSRRRALNKAKIDQKDVKIFEYCDFSGRTNTDRTSTSNDFYEYQNNEESKGVNLKAGPMDSKIGYFRHGVGSLFALIKVLLSLNNQLLSKKEEDPSSKDKKSTFALFTSVDGYSSKIDLVFRDYYSQFETCIDDLVQTTQPLLISADCESSLILFAKRLLRYVKSIELNDYRTFKSIVYTLNCGRNHHYFRFKTIIFAKNGQIFEQRLRSVIQYLECNELKTVSEVDERVVRSVIAEPGFLCFAVNENATPKKFDHVYTSFHTYLYSSVVYKQSIDWKLHYTMKRTTIPQLPTSCFDEGLNLVSNGQSTTNCTNVVDTNKDFGLKSLLERELLEVREITHSIDLKPEPEFEETMDRFALTLIGKFFKAVNLQNYWEIGKTYKTNELFARSQIIDKYFKLFQVMLAHLEKCGIISGATKGSFTILRDFDWSKVDTESETIAEYGMKRFVNYKDCFQLPLITSKRLKDVLSGNLSPFNILFPRDDFYFILRHEKTGDPLGTIYMKKSIQTIGKYVIELATSNVRTIKVLEIGGGFGTVTRQIVPKFANIDNVEYYFTDISTTFVQSAKKIFSEIGTRMQFVVFDITKSAAKQGIHEKFDVVIALNVIHATNNIKQTCANLSKSIRDDGVFFIVEGTRNSIWADMTWGILDGWWAFEDSDIRSGVMCNAQNWERILKELNFQTIYTLPTNPIEREFVEKFMFVSTKQKLGKLSAMDGWWECEPLIIPQLEVKSDSSSNHTRRVERSNDSLVEKIKSIWKKVLNLKTEITDKDIFAELGGDSILAFKMTETINEEIGADIELAHCYAYPSLREFSQFVKSTLEA